MLFAPLSRSDDGRTQAELLKEEEQRRALEEATQTDNKRMMEELDRLKQARSHSGVLFLLQAHAERALPLRHARTRGVGAQSGACAWAHSPLRWEGELVVDELERLICTR